MTDSAAMTLYELNSMVRSLIDGAFHEACRVKAELSEVRVSPKGHCFIELIQKGRGSSVPVAKARGVIMADVFPLLKLDFEETTGQLFGPGIEVLLEVRPTFSEIYGYSLIVVDIDPTYTLGDMARQRREIMLRLEKEGVAALQKGLSLPLLPQRIAVISSPTAAGYGDFCHQIDENRYGYRFCYKHCGPRQDCRGKQQLGRGGHHTRRRSRERPERIRNLRIGQSLRTVSAARHHRNRTSARPNCIGHGGL